MATIYNPPTAHPSTTWTTVNTAPYNAVKKDRITFEIDPYCKEHDPGMYYMLLAYLYKHIENFEAVVQKDDDFKKYRIKTKVKESSGEFHFTVFYDKDVTRG